MVDVLFKKKKKKEEVQKDLDSVYPIFETNVKLRIKESTYNKLIRIPLKINSNKKSIDNRILLLLNMRATYLDLFGYLLFITN